MRESTVHNNIKMGQIVMENTNNSNSPDSHFFPQLTRSSSSTGWQHQTPHGSLECGDQGILMINTRIYGSKVRNIQHSRVSVSIYHNLAEIHEIKTGQLFTEVMVETPTLRCNYPHMSWAIPKYYHDLETYVYSYIGTFTHTDLAKSDCTVSIRKNVKVTSVHTYILTT